MRVGAVWVSTLIACGLVLGGCDCGGSQQQPDAGTGEVLGLKVSDAAARSCEVLLDDADRAVARLVFGSGVEGRFLREGPRVAGAFFSKTDAAPANADLGLELEAGASAANVQVSLGRCFDRNGQPLASATVEVVR